MLFGVFDTLRAHIYSAAALVSIFHSILITVASSPPAPTTAGLYEALIILLRALYTTN